MTTISAPILHIIVVGFHHKKGCQIEYSYPELSHGNPHELPSAWRHLPALALPDGSHNYHNDTVFFHLPGLTDPAHTVFAVSCFRQMPTEQVSQRTSDMTRSSVQKSICVISSEPLFGRLAVKLELVAKAWFRRGDFSNTQLLEDAYRHLNSCPTLVEQVLEGLSVTSLIETWRHKAVLLFKLLLLQRKVVIHGSPAGPVSNCLLSLLSLHPDCIHKGLRTSANIVLSRPMSPIPIININKTAEGVKTEDINGIGELPNGKLFDMDKLLSEEENNTEYQSGAIKDRGGNSFVMNENDEFCDDKSNMIGEREKCHSVGEKYKSVKTLPESHSSPSMVRDMSINGLAHLAGDAEFSECGLPLKLFSEGYLCLPYLSLQYMDLLSDPAVKGFTIGASNVLFKQKRQLFEVLVETGDLRIETADFALRRQLQLTTEDLRFADHLVRHGSLQGDVWIRDQFAGYLLCLLRTSLLPEGSREIDNFNASFVTAFKATEAFIDWLDGGKRGLDDLFTNMSPGHPFAGQLSVTDMKLRLAHTMSSTEGGRKVTQAVVSTGRAVASTSRAVGGAFSQAKGAFSVWWTTFTAPTSQGDTLNLEPDCDALDAVTNETETADEDISLNNSVKIDKSKNETNIISHSIDKITIHCDTNLERSSDAEEADESVGKCKIQDLNFDSNDIHLNNAVNESLS